MVTTSATTLYNSATNTRFPNPSLNLQSCHNATKSLSLKSPPPLINKHPFLQYSHHHQKKSTSGAISFRSLVINASSSSSPSLAASTKTKPFSVLFVCLGNICRSPAAEGVFTDIVKTRGLDSEFKIDSAGTIDYHEGNPADPRMRAASKRRGVEITFISRPIRPSDFRDFDIILAMDKQNREDIMEAFNRWKFREPLPDDAHKKVKLMCSFCKKHDETEVPDPYYGGPQGFEKTFIDEVMELVELKPLMNALVGLPRIDGLSTEQRKRLTIAVELVANPSIIFMDEPTSGLDARAAAIVMRAIRHMVDTGRTVVCTIHQPSIDIFETFDELLLMKRGGQVIYAGPLGHNSHKLVQYFEAVPGVPRIKQGSNPATWMLEISSEAIEAQLQVDFAEVYANSELYRKNQELVKKLSTPRPGSKDLSFPSQYPQSFITQCTACFWKQHKSYWRNSEFNYTRFVVAIIIGILFGLVFWSKGDRIYKRNDLINLLGAAYATVLFLGATNASAVQSVIATERTVFYRERAAGMYSELPYAFAHVAIEIIYVSIQTFIYSLLLYSTIGFEWHVCKFLYFYYFIFMSFTYFSMYGMMIISLTPGPEIAAVVMSFFISFWNLFSGYLITRPLIPVWWRWYYWASPVAWTIYGIFTSQVGDKNTLLEIPESEPVPLKAFVERYLGYDQEFLLPVVLAHVGWVLLFFFIFAYGIKFLNFQRR